MQLSLNSIDGVSGKLSIGKHTFDVIIVGSRIDTLKQERIMQVTHDGSVGGAMCKESAPVTTIEIKMIASGISSTDESIEYLEQIGKSKRMINLEG